MWASEIQAFYRTRTGYWITLLLLLCIGYLIGRYATWIKTVALFTTPYS